MALHTVGIWLAIAGAVAVTSGAPSHEAKAERGQRALRESTPDARGAGAKVQRTVHDGVETLRATTRLVSGARTAILLEEATIDAHGRLTHADARLTFAGEAGETRIAIDRAARTMRITRGHASVDRVYPGDEPWVYAPVLFGAAWPVMTPVEAWIAQRAASASDTMRIIDPVGGGSYVALSDTVVFPTEDGTYVVVGDDDAQSDDRFVRRLHSETLHSALVRQATDDPDVFRFVPEEAPCCGT